MWDPTNALGTVTHQHIGYLLPLDPFFWFFASIHVPVWFAQRIWTGSLLYFAGLGVYKLTKILNYRVQTQFIASLAYMLSPYTLQYLNRISDILLTYSAFGWMISFTILAAKNKGLRYPACFGIVVAIIGGTNGSSLVYAGLGPVVWLLYSTLRKEIPLKKALNTALSIGVITLLVSIWWAVALGVESIYGLNILKFTETVPAVASTSLASEVLRGLGYWFYYGLSALGPWSPSSTGYEEHIWLILISFALPSLAFLSITKIKWKDRTFFITLLVVGLLASVGTYPFASPTVFGSGVKWFMLNTTAGFALRSTDRATPLVLLSIAIFLGIGTEKLVTTLKKNNKKRLSQYALAAVAVLIIANMPALFDGQLISSQYEHPQTIPNYYFSAAKYLDSKGNSTRVLIEPGTDTDVYRWGTTIDPVLPGVMTRDSVEREQLPQGTTPSVDLQTAIDQPLQEGTFNPNTIAPLARLISAGDLILQSNLAYEDYDLPHPRSTYQLFLPTPNGLSDPVAFGKPVPNQASVNFQPMFGEQTLSENPNSPWPAPLIDFHVNNARPILRTESASDPVILDGGATGIVNSAASGLITGNPTLLYSGSFTGSSVGKNELKQLASKGAQLILTDTNRKEARRWAGTIKDVTGYTETAKETQSKNDYSNAPLNLFPSSGTNAQTVTEFGGIDAVSAYGNQVTYEPYQRPSMAIDGNIDTAWSYSINAFPVSEWWQVTLINPVSVNSVNLVQLINGTPVFKITSVTLTFNGQHPITYKLNAQSQSDSGQTLRFPSRTFRTLRITVNSVGITGNKTGVTDVGFSEVRILSIHAEETVRPPVDMLQTLGSLSNNDRLTVILDRLRVGPYPPRPDPEQSLNRVLWLPSQRNFSLTGTATINSSDPDEMVDTIVGRQGSNGTGLVARSSGRLPGFLDARASSAFDGSISTSWSPGSGLNQQIGSWVELDSPKLITFNHLNFTVNTDLRHSVPTKISISTENNFQIVNLPSVRSASPQGRTTTIPLTFPLMEGRRVRVTVLAVKQFFGKDVPDQPFFTLPVGIAEVGIPGVTMPSVPSTLPSKCTSNLLTINSIPVPIKLIGTTQAALAGKPIGFVACNTSGITIGPGNVTVDGLPSSTGGINVNRVVLDSTALNTPGSIVSPGQVRGETSPSSNASLKVINSSATSYRATLTTHGSPVWIVLGESQDKGWSATLSNGSNLGNPQLIDGYANGWLYKPPPGNSTVTVNFNFTPQKYVN